MSEQFLVFYERQSASGECRLTHTYDHCGLGELVSDYDCLEAILEFLFRKPALLIEASGYNRVDIAEAAARIELGIKVCGDAECEAPAQVLNLSGELIGAELKPLCQLCGNDVALASEAKILQTY